MGTQFLNARNFRNSYCGVGNMLKSSPAAFISLACSLCFDIMAPW